MTPSLSTHVTSLSLSQEMKRLGFPQVSLFWYVWDGERDYFLYHYEQTQVYEGKVSHILGKDGHVYTRGGAKLDKFSAYLSSEVMELLPEKINASYYLEIEKLPSFYSACYVNYAEKNQGHRIVEDATFLPNALAKLAIHLAKEGLLPQLERKGV